MFKLYHISRSKKNFFESAEQIFTKRIRQYASLEVIELKPPKYPKSLAASQIQDLETELLLKHSTYNKMILLDEKGKHFSSEAFAQYISKLMVQGVKPDFIIGGAYGFSKGTKQSAKDVISLSTLTFPHHLARLVFLEQLYRAFTILNNEPYHNA